MVGASARTWRTAITDGNGTYEFLGLPINGARFTVTVPAPSPALLGSSAEVTVGYAHQRPRRRTTPGAGDFALPANEPIPAGYRITSPSGTFTHGVPKVAAAAPFSLQVIPPTAPPGTTATLTVKLRSTSLPGNRNPLGSDGFEAEETIPITVTYDSRAIPWSRRHLQRSPRSGESPCSTTRGRWGSMRPSRASLNLSVPCSFVATGCWRSFPDLSAI